WLRAPHPHPSYYQNRKVFDLWLARLSVTLASTGALAPKKREQLKDARTEAAKVRRRKGMTTRENVRAMVRTIEAHQRKNYGERPLSYPRLCQRVATRLEWS